MPRCRVGITLIIILTHLLQLSLCLVHSLDVSKLGVGRKLRLQLGVGVQQALPRNVRDMSA
jgi:hypothetical protein